MAGNNPVGLIVNKAAHAALHPLATTGRTIAIGRMVVGQVGRTAVSVVAEAVGAFLGRDSESSAAYGGPPAAPAGPTPSSPAYLRPVPTVNEAGHPPAPSFTGTERADLASVPPVAVSVDAPAKQQGDPTTPSGRAEARRATARKTAVKRAPVATRSASASPVTDNPPVARKAAPVTKKPATPVTKKSATPVTKKSATPVTKKPATPVTKKSATPADVAEVVSGKTPAKKAPGTRVAKKAAGTKAAGTKAAAKQAPGTRVAKKAAATKGAKKAAGPKAAGPKAAGAKAPAKKTAATKGAKKAAATKAASPKAPAEKAPAKKAASTKATRPPAPPSPAAPQAPAAQEDTLVLTSDSSDGSADPTGGAGHLEQPLIDPGTVKAVQSELETSRAAADPDKG